MFFLLPGSFFRFPGGLAAYFSFPPGPSPLPPSRCQIGSGKGGKDPGGWYNMPPDSPLMGVVNSPQTTALQKVAVSKS